MRAMRDGIWIATVLLAGCSVSGRVERGIERQLQTSLGPGDRYQV